MKFKITRENRPTLKNYGRYKAVVVHENTIETSQIVREVSRSIGASRGSVIAVLIALSESVGDHLRRGDRVRLDDWGLLKLEIECEKVDNPDEFDENRHIRATRLHFLPESRHGRQMLYDGLQFSRDEPPSPSSSPKAAAAVVPLGVATSAPVGASLRKMPIPSENAVFQPSYVNPPNNPTFCQHEHYNRNT